MKQLFLKIIASLCALCMLAGCADAAPSPDAGSGAACSSGPQNAAYEPGREDAAYAPGREDAMFGPEDAAAASLRIVSGLRNNISWGCSSETGFYSLLGRSDGSVNICYLDYASRREIILCGSPDCLHNTESCTGWIAPGNGAAIPFVDGDHLYLAFLGNMHGLDDGVPPKIVRRDLNGQNETTLITFSSSETFLRPFVSDGAYLYFLKKSFQMGNSSALGTYELVQMDLKTGACALLGQWNEPHTLSLAGTDGKNLLVQDIGLSTGGGEDAATPHWAYTFYAVDPSTGESKTVWVWQTMEEISERGEGRVLGGKYYYYNSEDGTILQYDFEQGSLTTVAENVPELMTGTAGACFDCFADGNLFVQSGTGFYAAVSVETGGITELSLSYAEGEKEKPVRIVDIAGDHFVVTMGTREVMIPGFDYDGLPIESPSFEDTLALIAKEDYLANRANYIPLERYGQ
ncbi:MAG: hypothetical protein HDT26_13545 [Subdoligranulum sp.]|nr:hypothetical protein [Subdoligranulum sp.]